MRYRSRTKAITELAREAFEKLSSIIEKDKHDAVVERQGLPKDAKFRDIAKHNNIPRPDLDEAKPPPPSA